MSKAACKQIINDGFRSTMRVLAESTISFDNLMASGEFAELPANRQEEFIDVAMGIDGDVLPMIEAAIKRYNRLNNQIANSVG